MIIDFILVNLIKFIFLVVFIVISYFGNYFRTIFKKVYFNYFLTIFISNYCLIYIINTPLEFLIICEITFFLFVCLLHIYIPLLIDRSFTISIFLAVNEGKYSKKNLSEFFQNNFDLFIDKRIQYLEENNFIIEKEKIIFLTKKGKIISKLYIFFKKIFNISNNQIF